MFSSVSLDRDAGRSILREVKTDSYDGDIFTVAKMEQQVILVWDNSHRNVVAVARIVWSSTGR